MAGTDIRNDAAVVRWFESAHLDELTPEEQTHRLALLADFCDHAGQPPDDEIGIRQPHPVAGGGAEHVGIDGT